jgi:homoprotocatechuate degradation regulator HpaR
MRAPPRPNLAQLLMCTRESALRPFRPILRAYGLTGQQWRVMRALHHSRGGLAPAELAEMCQILAPSLSQILAGMERNGMVRRERSSVDLRRTTVTLTREAARTAEQVSRLVERQYVLIERAVGRTLLAEAIAAIERLREALDGDIPNVMDDGAPSRSRTPASPSRQGGARIVAAPRSGADVA